MELWSEIITEKSQKLLLELKNKINFILIGGWAVWSYSQAIKSKDIDIYINFSDFFVFQKFLLEKGISVSLNSKLNKYEVKMGEIDIDVYTQDHCNLIISCKDVFKKRLFKKKEGFQVIIPEALLILKLDSEKQRSQTIKGFKDRIDILSLMHKIDFNKKILSGLVKEYNIDLRILRDIITKSKTEYSYFFHETENLRELKKLKLELLKKFRELVSS